MRLPGPARGGASVPDMLPILNIVLLLLAFFLMLARMSPVSATVVLPRSAMATQVSGVAPTLDVRADGHVELDGRVVSDAELAVLLRQSGVAVLRVQADTAIPAQRVLGLMRLAHGAGVARVQLLVAGAGAAA